MDSGQQKLHLVLNGTALAKEEKLKNARSNRIAEESHPPEDIRRVKLRRLINKLNYINFQDRTILITFKHFRYDHTIRIEAKPLPCQDENLECCWADTSDLSLLSRYYTFDSLLVPDGQQVLQVTAELIRLDGEGADMFVFVFEEFLEVARGEAVGGVEGPEGAQAQARRRQAPGPAQRCT